jgi:hypothetical protein
MRVRSPTLVFVARTALAMPLGLFGAASKVPTVPDGPADSAEEFWAAMIVSACLVLAGGVFAGWVVVRAIERRNADLSAKVDAWADGSGRTPPARTRLFVGRSPGEGEREEG